MPGRALRNPFVKKLMAGESLGARECQFKCLRKCDYIYCINDRLMRACEGDVDNGLLFSGENVYRMKEIMSVREVFDQFVTQAESVYKEGKA